MAPNAMLTPMMFRSFFTLAGIALLSISCAGPLQAFQRDYCDKLAEFDGQACENVAQMYEDVWCAAPSAFEACTLDIVNGDTCIEQSWTCDENTGEITFPNACERACLADSGP